MRKTLAKHTEKKIILIVSIFFSFGVLMSSCAVSNDVVSGRVFQKRKYNRGWYFERTAHFNSKTIQEKTIIDEALIPSISDHVVIVAEENDSSFVILNSETEKFEKNNQALNLPEIINEENGELVFAEEKKREANFQQISVEDSLVKKSNNQTEEYVEAAKESHRKAWVFTLISLSCSTTAIIILISSSVLMAYSFAAFLGLIAVVTYILIFVAAFKTMEYCWRYQAGNPPNPKKLNAILNSAIFLYLMASFVMLLLCFIPLAVLGIKARKLKKELKML